MLGTMIRRSRVKVSSKLQCHTQLNCSLPPGAHAFAATSAQLHRNRFDAAASPLSRGADPLIAEQLLQLAVSERWHLAKQLGEI